jgi:hypothetical protein
MCGGSVRECSNDCAVAAKDGTADQERPDQDDSQKLDRLDEAFLFAQSIDATSYERQRDRLREELTLAQIDNHAEAVDELDVHGILAFAARILPRASDLWVQASLDYKQRLQQLCFPGRDRVRRKSVPQRHHFSSTWRRPGVLMKRR